MKKISSLHKNLLKWYYKNKRIFPWRKKPLSPYKILIAEIMLRRTTSKVVAKVFPVFIKKWPNLMTLKKASNNELISLIKPLGKYNLKAKVFKMISKGIKDKQLKNITYTTLIKFYGIGPYTANAFLCFALNKNVSIVDSNISRIYSRFFGIKNKNVNKPNHEVIKKAIKTLPLKTYYNYNMALLDLGALICLPKTPKCFFCPLHKECDNNK